VTTLAALVVAQPLETVAMMRTATTPKQLVAVDLPVFVRMLVIVKAVRITRVL
jgi:hypothetical protein